MAADPQEGAPSAADAVGLAGIIIAALGVALTAARLAYLVWELYGWWSGPVYLAAGVVLVITAFVGRLTVQKARAWQIERAATRILERSGGQDGD